MKLIRFIDLFAGLGGTRIGFEQACYALQLQPKCVFTSEIKNHAIKAYELNFTDTHKISGDITKINPLEIPEFDFLLAGFPCQPFSSAGSRKGFLDKRGELFFSIYEILKTKQPEGFLLENVDGLASHDEGKTLAVILAALQSLNYFVSWRILDSSEFGVPQKRRRIYIVGNKLFKPVLDAFPINYQPTNKFIEKDLFFEPCEFSRILTSKYTVRELQGKSIKDKRGGSNNIHSWDLGLKGYVNNRQVNLLSQIMKKRRSKKWAIEKNIDWMDGMPLTEKEIRTFFDNEYLSDDLNHLTKMGYLSYEHPKKKINVGGSMKRIPEINLPKGYNIVAGKLSFVFSHIIDPAKMCPTIVATEVGKIAVATKFGVRSITINEALEFSGFPKAYKLSNLTYNEAYDLIGNTVMPPVIKSVSERILKESI